METIKKAPEEDPQSADSNLFQNIAVLCKDTKNFENPIRQRLFELFLSKIGG